MHPELIPGWPLHSYGLMLVVAFYSSYFLSRRTAKKEGINPDRMMDVLLIAAILGIVGARALFVMQYSDQIHGFVDLFAIWNGGLVFYGGLITAVVGLLLYIRWKKLPVWKLADAGAPAIILGLALGKVGCFLNGCCFGGVCDPHMPLAVHFPRFESSSAAGGCRAQPPGALVGVVPPDGEWHAVDLATCRVISGDELRRIVREHPGAWRGIGVRWARATARPDGTAEYETISGSPALLQHLVQYPGKIGPEAEHSLAVHPTQLYMFFAGVAICGVLLLYRRWRRRPGEVFALLAVLYSVIRFVNEGFRDDTDPVLGPLTISQTISIGVFTVGLVALIFCRVRGAGRLTTKRPVS